MNQENLCVLIDFENIAAGTERENLGRFNTKLVMNHLKEKGRILLSRAYGDWGRFAKFKQSLLIQGISMMELTSYRGQDKNRADIALVVDAMELVYTRPHIQTFVLMSGDSDFTPLVMKLRELNKRIIGLGTRKATSRLLADSCDEFIFYDNLLKRSRTEEESTDDTTEATTPPSLTSQQAYSILVETVTALQRDEARPVPAGMVKQFILRKHPTFDETELGHNGFKNFLESAAKRDLVVLESNAKGGGYMVSLLSNTPASSEEAQSPSPEFTQPLATQWFEMLLQQGHHITNHFVRHTIAHEFVDHVLERRSQQKRSTLLFTYGDVARRCRRTSPTASISEVEQVLNALQKAGFLIGNDKKPIRSKRANFIVRKDAEEMLAGLRVFYVKQLFGLIEDHSLIRNNLEALSELLWNDTEHTTEVSVLLEQVPMDAPDVTAVAETVPTADPSPNSNVEPQSTVATPPSPQSEESSVDTATEESAKPKKRSPRRKTATKQTAKKSTKNTVSESTDAPIASESTEQTASPEPTLDEGSTPTAEAPTEEAKPKRKRRTTKKTESTTEPKKTTRKSSTRSRSKKTTTPEESSAPSNPDSTPPSDSDS
jgi:uncharacterized protein (TIGR00288 family)